MLDSSEDKKRATENILRQTREASRVDVHKEEDHLWSLASGKLCDQIKRDGKNLGKGILKARLTEKIEGGKEGGRKRGGTKSLQIV
jgi:hypothetical protein